MWRIKIIKGCNFINMIIDTVPTMTYNRLGVFCILLTGNYRKKVIQKGCEGFCLTVKSFHSTAFALGVSSASMLQYTIFFFFWKTVC